MMTLPDEFWSGLTAMSIFGILGALGKWLWTQFKGGLDARARELDARETEFERKRDARVAHLEDQVATLERRLDELFSVIGRQRTAIHLLVLEVNRLDPAATVLAQIRGLLGDEMPVVTVMPPVPQDLADLAKKLDE